MDLQLAVHLDSKWVASLEIESVARLDKRKVDWMGSQLVGNLEYQ